MRGVSGKRRRRLRNISSRFCHDPWRTDKHALARKRVSVVLRIEVQRISQMKQVNREMAAWHFQNNAAINISNSGALSKGSAR